MLILTLCFVGDGSFNFINYSKKAEGKFLLKLTLFFFSDGSLDFFIYFKMKAYGFIIYNSHEAEFSGCLYYITDCSFHFMCYVKQ